MPSLRNTGMPQADAQDDFLRARRRAVLARLGSLLRRQPEDVGAVLPFDEVVEALGRVGERDRGLQTIPLDSVVGSVDRTRDFDRLFRPRTQRVRPRWERIALATRRGEAMPPIEVYRVGDAHFVRDGHHRVSVARAHGLDVIDAHVIEVLTRVGADRSIRIADLPLKSHERMFWERVPLPVAARDEIRLSDPWLYGELAESVEAWGFRLMQAEHQFIERDRIALRWHHDELRPTIALLTDAGLVRRGETETDAYVRLTSQRYRLTRTHVWTDEVLDLLRGER